MTEAGLVQATWCDFDGAWYRAAHPVVERMLADAGCVSAEPIFRAIGRVFMHAPNPYFDERWYQGHYKAVREAIAAGRYASGFEHYRLEGHASLAPHWLFNPDYYRAQWSSRHPEALPEHAQADPYGHFLAHGQHEGLSGHCLFDPSIYAAFAPYDVARRIERDGAFTTLLQQITAGDDPATCAAFDPAWYRERYPDVAAGIARKEWLCSLHHYLTNNDAKSFDPSARFCEQSYTAWHFDVAAAVRNGEYRNGFEHFMLAGRREHRFFTPADQDDADCVTARFPLRVAVLDGMAVGEPADAAGSPREGTFILGGTIYPAYGACLVHSLSRLWYLREQQSAAVLWWMDPALPPRPAWPDWLQELWRLLELDRHRHVFLTEPARFQRVLVPDPGTGAEGIIHEAQIRALAVRRSEAAASATRIWLSRPDAEPLAADQVEALLADRGWTILRPETLPLPEQIDLFSTAGFVSGFVSSAFLTVLLSANPTAMLLPVLRPGADAALFDTVAKSKGVAQSFIRPRVTETSPAELADPGGLADAVCEIADEAAKQHRLGRFVG